MMDLINGFQTELENGPRWVFIWVSFMSVVFMLSIPFSFVRKEARWVLLTILITFPVMMLFYKYFGYERILGLVHVIVWPPVLIYLWKRRSAWKVGETWSGKWIAVLVATMLTSLVFDVTDVIRYFLGHKM